jgi:hypothetical protein
LFPTIKWLVPQGIDLTTYSKVCIYYSTTEGTNYTLLDTIDAVDTNGNPITSYEDTFHSIVNKDSTFYVVAYYAPTTDKITDFVLTYKDLTPKEKKLVFNLANLLSPFISNTLTDEELRQYLEQGLKAYNINPPVTTDFTMFTLPPSLEPIILLGGAIFGAYTNVLKIAFGDVSITDNGIALTINRGEKITALVDKINAKYKEIIEISKLDYAYTGQSVGSVPLPIGIGNNLGRSIMNVFDLIGALGR